MELNEKTTLSSEIQFCEKGNRLAMVFVNASREIARKVYTESVTDAQARVDTALSALHWHVANCPDCNED